MLCCWLIFFVFFLVALTACGSGTYNPGDTVKFNQVKEHKGLQSLESLKQSGIFTCERGGMYVFFASILTNSADGYFIWYKNSVRQSGVYISHKPPSYESGSGMFAVELSVGDTVSLICQRRNIVVYSYSCFTFFKIY